MLETLSFQPLKAILFDLDGTLIDSVPDLALAVDAALVLQGLPEVGEARVRGWVGNGAPMLVTRALAYSLSVNEREVDEVLSAKVYKHFLSQYQVVNGSASRLYPGVQEALSYWCQKGFKMAVVTNKPKQFIPDLLQHFQLSDYFPVTVGGDSLPEKKPSAAPLFHACDRLGVGYQNTVMVGDSRTDVLAARAAAMPVVCVTYGYNHNRPVTQENPDLVINSFKELIE